MVVQTGGKSTAGVTKINVNLAKDVTAGVIDTGDKFATGVNDAGGIQFVAVDIGTGDGAPRLRKCRKKFKIALQE